MAMYSALDIHRQPDSERGNLTTVVNKVVTGITASERWRENHDFENRLTEQFLGLKCMVESDRQLEAARVSKIRNASTRPLPTKPGAKSGTGPLFRLDRILEPVHPHCGECRHDFRSAKLR